MSLYVTVPTARLAENIGELPEGVELDIWDLKTAPPRTKIDIVVPPYMGASSMMKVLEGVEVSLVQGQSIGYEGVEKVLPEGMRFANAASVHETSTAELALALTLAAQRQLPRFVLAKEQAEWSPVFAESFADRRVLLIGYGGVGTAIAQRLHPFEVELTVVARTARQAYDAAYGEIMVHGIDELPTLLPQAEIVILTLPGGAETQHLMNDETLSLLADDALLVNVGRGSLIDTEALLRHTGRIRFATDVLEEEPLPTQHPLWKAPGVLISPHIGGASTAMNPRIARLVRTQIERMLSGEDPLNLVLGG